MDTCKYYSSSSLAHQNSVFAWKGKLTILHLNVRSLVKNGEDFKDLVLNLYIKISCLLVTETWLREETVPPSLYGFTLRQQNRIGRDCGGVAIFLHSSLNYLIREDLKCTRVARLKAFSWKLTTGSKNITVGCIYRPLMVTFKIV